MRFLDLQALADAPLMRDPFMFTVVRDFVHPETRPDLLKVFPTSGIPACCR